MAMGTDCKPRWKDFLSDEDGAVTVDWVVLTAAVVGVGLALFTTLTPAVMESAGTAIADTITAAAARP